MFSTSFVQRQRLPAIAVTVTNNQPEILFIHGCTETAEIWFPLMESLAQLGLSCAAIDLRGHGKSQGFEELQNAGIGDYVADARSAFEEFPTLRVAIGHSMGGLITQLLAAELPLDHAILIASSPVLGMQADSLRMARKHLWTFLMASAQRSFKRLYTNPAVTRSLLFHSATPDSTIRMFMSKSQEDS